MHVLPIAVLPLRNMCNRLCMFANGDRMAASDNECVIHSQ